MTSESRTTDQFCAALFRKAPFEFRLLAACCVWPVEHHAERIGRLISTRNVDWNLLLELGERHRVSGLLAHALKSQADVPESARQLLARRAARIERDNLLQVAISVNIARAMQREGIPFVIMKGAPLAFILQGTIALRHSKDIDLLVARETLSAVQALLLTLGFVASSGLGENLTPKQAASWERSRKNYDYKHAATGTQVELHWRAFDNSRLGELSAERAEWVECAPGVRLPALSRGDLFPLLCAHGASHAWFRLKWLADVATLLAQGTKEEQQDLLCSARSRGLERPAEQAFLLAASFFGDQRIQQPQKSTSVGRWLAGVGRDALLQAIPISGSNQEFVPKRLALSKLLLRRSWVYRWEEVQVYSASPADWKTINLPDWLHFAYPVVRIPLWLRRQWGRRRRA